MLVGCTCRTPESKVYNNEGSIVMHAAMHTAVCARILSFMKCAFCSVEGIQAEETLKNTKQKKATPDMILNWRAPASAFVHSVIALSTKIVGRLDQTTRTARGSCASMPQIKIFYEAVQGKNCSRQ